MRDFLTHLTYLGIFLFGDAPIGDVAALAQHQ